MHRYYMVDNNDSFVFNLAAYFKELGHDVVVERVDRIDIKAFDVNKFDGIIISPGPGSPEKALLPLQIIMKYKNRIPILGVCLGHQVIAHAFGGIVRKGQKPMHGKVTKLHNTGYRLFKGLPETFSVTRYHSLVVDEQTIGDNFFIDSFSEDGAVMAISHKSAPIYGVQFHPEAVLTEYGYDLLKNFHNLCVGGKTEENQAAG